MARLRRTPASIALYRRALRLCPPAFHRDYADQMLRDFIEARTDARTGTRADRWRCRGQMTIDLVRTVAVQWVRSGALVIALLAMTCTSLVAGAIATVIGNLRFDLPPQHADAELLGLVLIATAVVMLLTVTIVFTLGAATPALRRRR